MATSPLKESWKRIVRQWRIDHDGMEISKFDVPAALAKILNDPRMTTNIQSGFKVSGLYPLQPNNVDYSKIVLRSKDGNTNINIDEKLKDYFDYIESKIGLSLLRQFKSTKEKTIQWEGNPDALLLYKFWLSVANEMENQPNCDRNTLIEIQNVNELSPVKLKNQTNFLLNVETEITSMKENSHFQITRLQT